ncbi:TetR/AcrR family transcriptional regulator [Gryllotalpicola reticulitermitis]|uniref:TetR/AcrR family transcriptional regulator n=1 Tax=Gryllotalpicola reticulitermitis TaxID=1184153 RepID=A0ABV8Q1A3_9MICO
MAGDVRQRMVEGTVRLLARGGYHGTSFADVIGQTGAPRGSIYHHFPGGKDELVVAALELADAQALTALTNGDATTALGVVDQFIGMWRRLLVGTQFEAGCSVLGVTVSADTEVVLDRAAEVFRDWRGTLAARLEETGFEASEAGGFATLLIAATEGAVVMCRAARSVEPLETVADELRARARGERC